ncbi:hypothetical protein l11_01600 [Neisseria weaveri LMG 5135]|nr:hypothetical protein l11_01600 [Neisseria weaveri LMG 5135]
MLIRVLGWVSDKWGWVMREAAEMPSELMRRNHCGFLSVQTDRADGLKPSENFQTAFGFTI